MAFQRRALYAVRLTSRALAALLLITVAAGDRVVWAAERAAERASSDGDDRDHDSQAAHGQIGELQWRLGVIARDQQRDPIKAAHYFYRAARSARLAEQPERADDFLLAAQNAAGIVDLTIVHDRPIRRAVFSPDGNSVLTWADMGERTDRSAWLWNMVDGRLIRSFDHGGGSRIRGATFSPDGRRLLTWSHRHAPCGYVERVWLWDLTKDEPAGTFDDRFGQVEGAAFTPDSSRFFVWSDERRTWDADRKGNLWLWDIESDEAVVSIPEYVETPKRNGPRHPTIIYGPRPPLKDKDDFDAWQKDLRQKEQFVQKLTHPNEVVGAMFSPDGDRVLTWCYWDDRALLWNVKRERLIATLGHPRSPVGGASFNADATQILVWNNTTGQGGFRGRFSNFRVWDLGSYRPSPCMTVQYEGEINGAAFEPSGERVLVWSDDRTLRMWNARPPELVCSIPLDKRMGGAVLNSDATRAFAWSRPEAWAWDMESGELLQTFTHPEFHGGLRGGAANPEGTRFLTWSANDTIGDEVELTSDVGSVWVWDVSQREPLHTLHYDGWVNSAVFSADGSRVLSASEDNTARLWDAETGKLLHVFPHERDVGGAVFGPGESRILTWGGRSVDFRENDDTVRLWDAASGKLLQTLPHVGVEGAKLNADGTHVLSWGSGKANLWDVDSDRPLATFSRKTGGVALVSFRVDTPWIAVTDDCDPTLAATIRMVWRNVEHVANDAYRAPGSQRTVVDGNFMRACALVDYLGVAELYSSCLDSPVSVLGRAGFEGAEFRSDSSRLLTWGRGLQLWNIALRDERPIERQLLDHEFRTATRLDETGRIRVLSVDEWRELNRERQAEGAE